MSTTRREANEAREVIIDKLRQEGLEAAYKCGIKLLNDDNVPATAQASLVRVMFQAGGLLTPIDEDAEGKASHEMSADELEAAIGKLHQALKDKADGDETVFG